MFVIEIVADSVQFLEPKSASGGKREVTSGTNYNQGQGNTSYQKSSNQGSGQGSDQGNQQDSSKNKDSDIFDAGKPMDINDEDLPF